MVIFGLPKISVANLAMMVIVVVGIITPNKKYYKNNNYPEHDNSYVNNLTSKPIV